MEVLGVSKQTLKQPSAQYTEGKSAGSYYRPELDVLRFFAFFCVFIGHGPRLNFASNSPMWKHAIGSAFNRVAYSGVYGLPLFFFLSSFLITELLLRERAKTGSVHIKSFYVRRVLRIWPLYYLGALCAVAVSMLRPHDYGLTHRDIAYFIFFLGISARLSMGIRLGLFGVFP